MATSVSQSSGESSSTPGLINSPQSDWELQLAQYLQQVGNQQMQWAQQEYARAGQVTDAQINNYINTAQQGSNLAGSVLGRYNDLYAPQADQYAREAGSYASQGRLQHEMGRAESGVMQAGRQAEINAEQELESFGIDPSSGRYQDLVRASKTADAAAAVGAGEQARRTTEMEGTRRRENAMNYGAQLPAAGVNALNSAYQGIAGAENAALGLANTGVNLTTSASKFYDPAMGLKYPPVGNTSQSRQGSTSQSTQPGGSGGGRGSDPFPRPPSSQGGNVSGSQGNVPAYANPNGNFASRGPRIQGGLDTGNNSSNDWQTQDMWDQNTMDPASQGEAGVLNDNGWGQGMPSDYVDPGNWQDQSWNGGSTYGGDLTTPQANWPDPGTSQSGDTIGSYDNYGSSYSGNDQYTNDMSSSSGYDYNMSTPDANWGDYAGGGAIPPSMSPSGGQQVDDVPAQIPQTGGRAQLNVDEFVIPRDVAMWKGQEFFQKLIQQSRQARTGAPAKPSKGRP
jgi:hypothetical protein